MINKLKAIIKNNRNTQKHSIIIIIINIIQQQ